MYLFAYRSVSDYGPEPWTIGTYLDGERTRTQVRRLVAAAAGGVAILVVFLIAAVALGRAASRPARRLAAAAEAVRAGRLDAVAPLPASRIRELDGASSSFDHMVEGLRERNVIRDLFGKFVPERVAAQILHSPEGLEPQACEATILFTDLAGFTALTEQVGPVEIVAVLNDYFTDLVREVEAHDGVVTQLQGDAILAVFNVPLPVDDHAGKAIRAALAIRETVAGRLYKGHRLQCRTGVNTGSVVAGNVGASGRMNYTVHGDAVNLAARLEQLNKAYGTDLLVSSSTATLSGRTDLREVDSVEVRGRVAPVTVLTVDREEAGTTAGQGDPGRELR